MAELGRAACPAPMWSTALANLALSGSTGRRRGANCWKSCTPAQRWPHSASAPAILMRGAGSIRIDGRRATGVLRFVEAAGATHLLVAVDAVRTCPRPTGCSGHRLAPTRAMGAWGSVEVRLNSVPLTLLPLESGDLDDLRLKAQIALLARAHGAARRAFELAVDYAKERHQFGQPIGKFQAIQHKLANCLDRARRRPASSWIMRPGCTTLATATGAISPIARLPSAATRCGAFRSRPSIRSAPSAMPKSTRRAQHFKRVHLGYGRTRWGA